MIVEKQYLFSYFDMINIQKVPNEEAKFKSFKIKVLKSGIIKIRNKGFLLEGNGIKFWK